ncbi:flagellar hook protein FlgE [Ferrimicrobium acidiphilum]|uniref:Flagellar hook protein FlgE n=4 Tax=Ferrimicrobium acidiphilum TaxID=121039 RepID=A0A0D8FTH9_9ACTN|nr:flagellar hook-basal body complex protein [Ferrimicrobium acidiphilum]KJE76590.1 flagellar hook protein FlgE [Ferrimicrobium acidiphilum DSM 19497]
MTKSLSAAITGINADQQWLDNIANNIANSNTVGYQSTSIQFADLLYQQSQGAGVPVVGNQGGTNPVVMGSGVRVASNNTNFGQGTMQQTGVSTDLAISGNGFLVVSQGGQNFYTRDGALQLDAAGQLVTSTGAIVQGWAPGANGQINQNSPLTGITIPQGQVASPKETQNITLGGNLAAGATNPVTVTTTAYDSLGDPIPITFTFTPSTTANTWTVSATVPPAPGSTATGAQALTIGGANSQTVTFDPTTGQIKAVSGSETGTNNLSIGGFANPGYKNLNTPTMNLDFPAVGSTNAVTQFAGSSSSLAVTNQDGAASGALTGFSIGSNGTVQGTYANGTKQVLGQIASALFTNPEGLAKQGNLLYQATLNSGAAQLGAAGAGGRGTFVGGSVEGSNVNLGNELTNLVLAQTDYQANTKVVSTTASVLQALVQNV